MEEAINILSYLSLEEIQRLLTILKSEIDRKKYCQQLAAKLMAAQEQLNNS